MILNDDSALKRCYERLGKLISWPLESFEIVSEVQKYRAYWKPEKVRTILLAESHVFTTDDDFQCEVNTSALNMPDYPNRFVRFVYCLGYGENSLLTRTIANNPGSRSFWKIFSACCNDPESCNDHHPVLKTKAGSKTISNRIRLLNEMKERGIWLLDASIIGINSKHKPDKIDYWKVISTCWDFYVNTVIKQVEPENMIIVGKAVSGILHERVKEIIRKEPTTVPLLNSHLTSAERLMALKSIHSVCNQDYSPPQDTSEDIEHAWQAEKISEVSNDMKDIPGRDSIRKMAYAWLADRCKKVPKKLHCSKYYQANKSWTKAPAWWIEIPEKVLVSENCKYVYLLLQKSPQAVSFYCLQVPTSYLNENKENLKINRNKISLFLAAEGERMFSDQRNDANIAFANFLLRNDTCK